MSDLIFNTAWWKYLVVLLIWQVVYGIPLHAYTEYKISLTRHGSWPKHYYYKLNNLIKPRSYTLYLLFKFNSLVTFGIVVLMLVSLLK